MIPKRAQTRSS
ncbi:hypothetical protein VCHENC02_0430A, partial [Vibrio harveyi]